jgi:hypothetical protein
VAIRKVPASRGVRLALVVLAVGVLTNAAPQAGARSEQSWQPKHHTAPIVRIHAGRLVSNLKLANYYPARNAWSLMWTRWRPREINHDMARAATLHANAIRVIAFPYTMGWPEVRRPMESRLRAMLAMASRHGLKVELTLYDHWEQYGDRAQSRQWTQSILRPLRGNETVAFIEVKNEIEPSNSTAMQWLPSQIRQIHRVLPGVPVTVSADGQLAGLLALKQALGSQAPDFWDLHYYGPSRLAYATFVEARLAVGKRPLIVGETGASTAASVTNAASWTVSDDFQREWFYVVEAAAAAAGLPPAAPWTLDDFTSRAIPYPHVADAQYRYGLFRTNGTPKPAAHVVASAFKGRPPTSRPAAFRRVQGSDLPSMWHQWYPSGQLSVIRGAGPHGDNAVQFAHTLRQLGGVTSIYTTPVQPVRPHRRWTASVRARGIGSTGANFLSLSWYDANDNWLGNSESRVLKGGSTNWTRLHVQARPPPGAAGVSVYLDSAGNRGRVLFANPRWATSR